MPAETTPTTLRDREPGTLTAEEETRLRAEHVIEFPERHEKVDPSRLDDNGMPMGTGEPLDAHCDSCWEDWPCSVVRLLATLDTAREQAATEARRELNIGLDADLGSLLTRLDAWAASAATRYESAAEMVEVARRDLRSALGIAPDRPANWQGHDHALRTFGGHPVARPFPRCVKCSDEVVTGDD